MLRTPLHQFHVDAGGKMVEFAGWEMPMLYSSIHDEHTQVRASGGLFDVSHMGRVRVSGRHARRMLERLCTRRIADMETGQCRYSLMCNERGGVRDDVIVYRMDDDEFLVVVNGANREKMLTHFDAVKAAGGFVATIEDQTLRTAMVAMQGPKVMDLISRFSTEIPTLKRYRFAVKNLLVMKIIVSRTGYTGEDGVEAILPATGVSMAMKLLLKDADPKGSNAVVKPAGLGARDTLRIEAGMPLYGHELGEDIDALGCGVDFAIAIDKDQDDRKEGFIGMEALKRTRDSGGPPRRLAGITLEGKRTARQGNVIRAGDGREIGVVSSACLSPTLGLPIGMGFVERAIVGEVGQPVRIDTGRGELDGRITKLPFYSATRK